MTLTSSKPLPQKISQSLAGKAGVYVHWPFCASRCPYCDFNVHLNNRHDDALWAQAYKAGLNYYAGLMPGREIASIFFGGGTPSLMSPALVEQIISHICKLWPVADDLEVTLEANPTSAEIWKFRDFKTAGVSRLSIGVQALDNAALKFLGRRHSAKEGLQAIEMGSRIFGRTSFDLIYARPGQSLSAWEEELQKALNLANGHVSLYELTIEEKTPFYKRHAKGEFQIPEEEEASDFYKLTYDIMSEHGLPAYEIANYAAPGQECRYNMLTWLYEDYIGIGPGAHGRITSSGDKIATYEQRMPEQWLKQVQTRGHGLETQTSLNPRDRFEEALITGLRLTGGISVSSLEDKSGLRFEEEISGNFLRSCEREGWLRIEEDWISLSAEGLLRYDAIICGLLC